MTEPGTARTRALAARIDHTLLRPEATTEDIRRLCGEARDFRPHAVCVGSSMVAVAATELAGTGIAVASVIGFPTGAHRRDVKASEAAAAVSDGATELDMVIDLGAAAAGDWTTVAREIAAVRSAAEAPVTLKVIIESGLLAAEDIARACRTAEEAGADFVKTSTGFHPTGGATVEDIRVMAATVGPRLGVKASGGITTAEQALRLLDAGATRLGLSRSVAILAELEAGDPLREIG